MTLANYSELEGTIGRYLDRTDRTVEIQEWVRLVELEVGRKLRLRAQQLEVSGTLTGGAEFLDTPAGILHPQQLVFDTEPPVTVDVVTFPQGEETTFAEGGRATPLQATVWGVGAAFETRIRVWPPSPADVPYTLRYVTGIVPLTAAAPTNYLLLVAADLYLFGCLFHGHLFDENPEQAAAWRPQFEEQIRQVRRIEALARAKIGRLHARPRSPYALLG
jgi:hypothetical protein